MIRSLQKRFVFAAMLAVTALLLVMLGAVNIANIITEYGNISERLQLIADTEGDPKNLDDASDAPGNDPGGPSDFGLKPKGAQDVMLSATYFIVRYDTSGSMVYADTGHMASLSDDEMNELADRAYGSSSESGRIGRFIYLSQDSEQARGTTIAFLDITDEIYSCIRIGFISLAAGLLCWLLMLALMILLSKKAIRPVAESLEKQKQFITNAGHEIKTPLAIIRANADALELYQGESKWSANIRQQTVRLDGLMKNLLFLARMDESTSNMIFSRFDLSSLTAQAAEQFEEPARSRGLTIKASLQPGLTIEADREQVTQLLSILIDNASKYARTDTDIDISLERDGRYSVLTISNLCEKLPEAPQEQLFERFYRADSARTQKSGGYGIGLSAARQIAAANKAEIRADYAPPDRITFTVRFRHSSGR